jgi:hypothetical protein
MFILSKIDWTGFEIMKKSWLITRAAGLAGQASCPGWILKIWPSLICSANISGLVPGQTRSKLLTWLKTAVAEFREFWTLEEFLNSKNNIKHLNHYKITEQNASHSKNSKKGGLRVMTRVRVRVGGSWRGRGWRRPMLMCLVVWIARFLLVFIVTSMLLSCFL